MTKNEQLKPDYKKWVVSGQRMPQVVASLILGVNPDIAVFEDPKDWQHVDIRVHEVNALKHHSHREIFSVLLYHGVPHFDSFVKYVATFFKKAFSSCRR